MGRPRAPAGPQQRTRAQGTHRDSHPEVLKLKARDISRFGGLWELQAATPKPHSLT